MKNSLPIINVAFESNGIHLICVDNKKVAGTGRLKIKNTISVISQMTI